MSARRPTHDDKVVSVMKSSAVATLSVGMCDAFLATLATAPGSAADLQRQLSGSELSDAGVRARADALVAQMTTEEKVGQLGVSFALPYPAMMKIIDAQVSAGKLGGLLFVTDPDEVNRLQHLALDHSRLKIPLIFGFEGLKHV
jgi:beta-glucosidase